MTPELRKKLIRTEDAMNTAKRVLAKNEYRPNTRTAIVLGFMTQMVEHQEAILLLTVRDMVGSAFALARSVFEGVCRGVWINCCATDAEVKRFKMKDEIGLTMAELSDAIDTACGTEGFYKETKTILWKTMNSYTHTGMMQVSRRFSDNELKPSYDEDDIYIVASHVTTSTLLLIANFLGGQNLIPERDSVYQLLGTY
jgi:hypothetical protein